MDVSHANTKELCDAFGFMLDYSGKLLIYNPNNSSGTTAGDMAIAPDDPRHPDLTASDVLAPQTWPKRGIRPPAAGLDVICTKIAVDFQSMTAATALEVIGGNLELLRETTHTGAIGTDDVRQRRTVATLANQDIMPVQCTCAQRHRYPALPCGRVGKFPGTQDRGGAKLMQDHSVHVHLLWPDH